MATKPKAGGYNYQYLNAEALSKIKKARDRIRARIELVRKESDKRRAMKQWDANDLIELTMSLGDIADAVDLLHEQQNIIKDDRRTNVIEFPDERVSGDE